MSDEQDDDPALCADCECAVIDPEGRSEWYMVLDEVWDVAVPEDTHNMGMFLCIGCLEKRLGRQLTSYDFNDAPINGACLAYGSTKRLIERLVTPHLSPNVQSAIISMARMSLYE